MCRKITSHWQPLFSKKMVAAASFSYKIGGGGLIFLQNWRRWPHFPTKLAAAPHFPTKLAAAARIWQHYWRLFWHGLDIGVLVLSCSYTKFLINARIFIIIFRNYFSNLFSCPCYFEMNFFDQNSAPAISEILAKYTAVTEITHSQWVYAKHGFLK